MLDMCIPALLINLPVWNFPLARPGIVNDTTVIEFQILWKFSSVYFQVDWFNHNILYIKTAVLVHGKFCCDQTDESENLNMLSNTLTLRQNAI